MESLGHYECKGGFGNWYSQCDYRTSFTVLSYVKASSFLGIFIFVYICPNFVSLYERRHIGDIICEFLASGLKDTA